MQRIKNASKFKKLFVLLSSIIAISFLGFRLVATNNKTANIVDPKVIGATSAQKVELNKEMEFEIQTINDSGQFLSKKDKIKFIITEAELKDSIKVKGEERKAGEGQKYLILRIELQNDTPDRLAIISGKYVRLLGLEDKKFSPDFHNAMIAIDPLSVRRDLVAYIVNSDSNTFKFQIGELEGEKQVIEITF
ncbi:hypothetical protein HYT02_04765 [Candidatus Gottesmanbacteria bacterium]|nr:hypothetical protein [Candidatus Gottesmanbacteria bacterium]